LLTVRIRVRGWSGGGGAQGKGPGHSCWERLCRAQQQRNDVSTVPLPQRVTAGRNLLGW